MVMEESTCLSYYAEIPVAIIGNSVSNFRYFYLTLNNYMLVCGRRA